MPLFAQINQQNIVENILVVDTLHTENGAEFLSQTCNLDGKWIEVTDDNRVQIGFEYNDEIGFYPQQPYPSWVLDVDTLSWIAPVEIPGSPGQWNWDEDTLTWVEIGE